jgi:hypothetical protein
LSFAFLVCRTAKADNPSGYHLLNKIPVAGDKGWDYSYVDPETERLYVSHGDKVDVLDAKSDSLVGSVTGLDKIHGIAIAHSTQKGFITDGGASGVWVFDLGTYKTVSFVATAEDPDCVIYDEASGQVFVMGGDSGKATALSADGSKVNGVLDLDGKPEFACADGKGHVFVNLVDKSLLLRIDAKKLKVLDRWALAPGESPASLAMDAGHDRLFSGCHNEKLVVLNAKNGKVVATLPIGKRVDAGTFDPGTGNLFTSCGDGTLSVIHEDSPNHYTVVENVPTQAGSRTHALDPVSHRVYLSSAQFGKAPEPTAEKPHPRPPLVPGTFAVLEFGR